MKIALYFLSILMLIATSHASETKHSQSQKYAGEEKRDIKSLSLEDITELRLGGGWGLAKAAELNGMPGPSHLLKMKDKIPLTDDQFVVIEEIYKQMKTQAIKQGERLITLEKKLELKFRSSAITPDRLRTSLSNIATARMELRFTHLVTHLKTVDILSTAQILTYNELRGYSSHSALRHSTRKP